MAEGDHESIENTEERLKNVYRPLDSTLQQVRVLQFTSIQPLECTFSYTSLKSSTTVKYDAVSWSWGDARQRAEVEVDGVAIDIPANALEVLHKLCIAHRRYRVWIDAVCINQNDIEERSQQVSIMHEIYATAEKTLIWLGEDNGLAERAIDAIKAIDEWRVIRLQNTEHRQCGALCHFQVEDPFLVKTDWEAMLAFFSSNWFKRYWVIQEVALSSHADIFQGMHRICWEIVGRVANYLAVNEFHHDKMTLQGVAGVFNAQAMGRVASGSRADLLLIHGHRFEATDPKDRVFALYGLFGRDDQMASVRKAFLPDYSKALPEIYATATKSAMIDNPDRISLLLRAQQTVPRPQAVEISENFPSWVPRYDYVEILKHGFYPAVNDINPNNAKACLQTPASFAPSLPHELCVRGVVVDTIGEICGSVRPDGLYTEQPLVAEIMDPLFEVLSTFWQAAMRLNPSISQHQLVRSLRLTLGVGSRNASSVVSTDVQWIRDFRAFIKLYWPEPKPPFEISRVKTDELEMDDIYVDRDEYGDVEEDDWDISDSDDTADSNEEEEDSDEGTNARDADDDHSGGDLITTKPKKVESRLPDDDLLHAVAYLRDILENAANRQYFVAESGRLGSAARKAQAGDVVVIIFGLSIPVILRRQGEKWTWVGDVYLNGIMEGEHIKQLQDDGMLEEVQQWFSIV